MPAMTLEKRDAIFVLSLHDAATGNSLDTEVLAQYENALSEVEASEGNTALVLRSDDPKNFSQGINLEWMRGLTEDAIADFVHRLDRLLVRLARLNAPTVAAINGHAFAGGALIATCCDFRLMRRDRGWFCYPEVDLGLPFTTAMQAVTRLLPERQALRDLILLGKRVGGEEALALKIVDQVCSADELDARALDMAKLLAEKDRATYTRLKRDMHPELTALADNPRREA